MMPKLACIIATLITLSPLAACATAKVTDAFRGGQPVADATGSAIAANPQAWDGKWVRIKGLLSATRKILYTPENAVSLSQGNDMIFEGSLYLNPRNIDLDDGRTYDRDEPGEAALVSGRVRVDCWEFWHPWDDLIASFAERDQVLFVHPSPPKSIAYCSLISGPYLDNVVVQSLTESVP